MNLKTKKILFILPSLKAGGAERVISFVAQNINKKKFEPTLLVLGFEKDKVYDISNVKAIFLNKARLLNSLLPVLKYIIKHKPNIVVSSIIHINIFTGFLAFFFKKIKFIAREASIISYRNKFSNNFFLNSKFLIKKIYNNFSFIICQSHDMLVDININYKISDEKLVVINNPITKKETIKKIIEKDKDYIKFITIGRLVEVKGHKRILYILAKLKNYNYKYTIYGVGPLEEELKSLSKKLNIFNKINFIPHTNEVFDEIRRHDVFLQGSYVEGFPNSVLESCIVGTPVIAFNAPGGTREIIFNGINGYLVKNEEEYHQKLKNIDEVLNLNPKDIREHVEKKFNSEVIMNKYQELFNR